MANFDKAWAVTAKNEGGYANDPNDNGGETYSGIARNYWPNWLGWHWLDAWKVVHGRPKDNQTFSEMANDVISFYKEHFWDKVMGDKIINQDVATEIFDSSVNMGIREAVILTQRTLSLPETGIMDILTLNSLNTQNPYA